MNNTNIDNFTKEIISGSKLELKNPDFNKSLMIKIKSENRKRIIYSNLKLYSLIFISVDAAIITLLNLTGIRFSDISFKIDYFSHSFKNVYSNPSQLILIYFAVFLAVILIIMIISKTGYAYSKEQN